MCFSQVKAFLGIGKILTHGYYRNDTLVSGSFENFTTILVENRITNMSMGIHNWLHRYYRVLLVV